MLSFFKKAREAVRPRCAALVPAAGESRRMGGIHKMLEPLDGVPVLVRTLTALQLTQQIDEIIIAAREEDLVEISRLCQDYGISKCTKVIRGGESRAHSVLLAALETSPDIQLLAVHDGARPLLTSEMADAVITAAARCSAAVPAVPLKDTVKICCSNGAVAETLERDRLRAVQTPQVFDASLLKAALQSAITENRPVTDDASAVEHLGKAVFLVDGDEENIKITTPLDLIVAEAILQDRKERA